MTFEAFLLWSVAFQMFFPVPIGQMCPFGPEDIGTIDLAAVEENIANMCPIGTGGLSEVNTFAGDPASFEQAATPAQTQEIDQPPAASSSAPTGSATIQSTPVSTAKVRDLLAKSRSAACTIDE
jgi:hypothetical protein